MSSAPDRRSEEEIGEEKLRQYEGIKLIGEGTYGKVYKVRSIEHNAEVVLKEVAWDDLDHIRNCNIEKIRAQITAEVECLSQSQHDHIVGDLQ